MNDVKSTAELRKMFEDLSTPTLLVVDDNPEVLRFIESALQPFNVQILTANDGGEAIDLMLQYDIDLVLLDLLMPQMNGYEVLKWMDEQEPPINLPTAILTGDPINPLVLQALDIGPVLLMQKPWTIRAFRKVMNYVPFAKAREYAPAT